MKKFILLAAVILTSIMYSFAEGKFTEQEQSLIDSFWNFRMELTCLNDNEEAIAALDSFKEKNKEQVEQLGKEASILLDALILMERYNYIYTFPGENKESRKPFSAMRQKLKAYMENKTEKDLTPYTYLCYADITSYYMAYSIKDIILHGMTVKRNQEKALKVSETFSPAMVNLAQWYYYSPKLFGGSKDLTREWQLKSIEHARTDAEKFYAKTAYSQFLFEMKEYEESRKELEDCAKLCPGSNFVKLLQEQNAMGNSLNDYNKQRSKLLKSADDYRKKNNIKD
ncbi:hypothetical protein [Treponema sp.]|uniref:hypothetical protein n=1 Tax=Treponema sp. TaxID=166 RepID=UPI00388FD801